MKAIQTLLDTSRSFLFLFHSNGIFEFIGVPPSTNNSRVSTLIADCAKLKFAKFRSEDDAVSFYIHGDIKNISILTKKLYYYYIITSNNWEKIVE